LRRLRPARFDDDRALQIGALRERLAAAEAELERGHTRETGLRERVEKLQRGLQKAEATASGRREDAGRFRHRVLSPQVLRDLMPLRLTQLRSRAAAADASARESKLIEVSERYRQQIAGGGSPPGEGAHRLELEGFAWWVPVGPADETRLARVLGKESIPFRAVLHAREVCMGGVMLDLGAHDGSTSIPRVALGDVEACYCAEPDPLNYACLVANTVDNGLRGFVLPDRLAIGDSNGTARLKRTTATRGHQVTTGEGGERPDVIDVPIRTLDSWVEGLAIDENAISFVKADIQGFELHMLRGASRLLARRHIAWQMEIDPALLAEAGSAPGDLFDMLARHFMYFIDLHPTARGVRRRPIVELPDALAYLDGGQSTDIIVYAAEQPSA